MIDVVLPVLDEAQALPWVLRRMPKGLRPIVVDNGSSDGSGEVARSLGVTVVDEPVAGFGAACFAGLMAAEADVVCFMDADASLDPGELERVFDPVVADYADLVVGRRVAQPGAWPLHARLANRSIAAAIGHRVGRRLHDVGPMRATRRSALIDLRLRDRRFGWPFEMVLAAGRDGWRIDEVPVSYLERLGRSKVTGTVRGTVRTSRDLVRVMRCT